MKSSWQQGNSV